MKLSIILPVFNNEETLLSLVGELSKEFSFLGKGWEIVAVEDGSTDSSWKRILKVVSKFRNVMGIRHAKNFGQHAAIESGLRAAAGDFVLVMDSDFQDTPADARRLYQHAQKGWDVVQGKRIHRKDSWIVRMRSKAFHGLFAAFTGLQSDAEVSNFSVYSRQIVSAYLRCPEKNKIMCLFVSMLGFRRTSIPVEHQARPRGQSTYSWWTLFRLAGLAIANHSKVPLYVGVFLGFGAAGTAGIVGIWIMIQRICGEETVPGWASLGVLLTFLMGTMFLIIGIHGIYIGLLFDEVRARPDAFIAEKILCVEKYPKRANKIKLTN